MTQVLDTRTRILNTAQAGILEKGFAATSIEEIVAAVNISKGGFFYHFPDKNALAVALIERYTEEENEMFDTFLARADDLNDDPLHAFLIALKFLAEAMADLPGENPGCLVAIACYQERIFDKGVHEMNARAVQGWRERFEARFKTIMERYPPNQPVDASTLADMVSTIVEGGIVLSKAYRNPNVLVEQILLFRSLVKSLFLPKN